MSSRTRYGLLSLVLVVLFGVAGAASACCGTTPTHFMTVTSIGKIDCDTTRGTGAVQWQVSYHLPPGDNLTVYSYGDSVIQHSNGYPNLPQAPGSLADTLSGSTVWHWEPGASGSRKVRIEFWVSFIEGGQWYDDRALIVFDCADRGILNPQIHNIDAELDI